MPTLNFDPLTGDIYGEDCECTRECVNLVALHMAHAARKNADDPGYWQFEWPDGTLTWDKTGNDKMTHRETMRILQNFIDCMPKAYRKRHDNAAVVRDIILAGTNAAGRSSCVRLCRDLGIDPYGYDFGGIKNDTCNL